MYILSEKEFEDILVIHPELIEDGLVLLERQGQLENRRTDLIFADKDSNLLLTELKRDIITMESVEQILDYRGRLKKQVDKNIRAMLIGQEVPGDIQDICLSNNIEWKEIRTEELFNYLMENDPNLYQSIFIEGKLYKEAVGVPRLSFQDYLNATSSPLGGPYTSYQFFAPIDASPGLSNNNKENQLVANEFMNLIKNHHFNRRLFQGIVHIKRLDEPPEWSVTAKGAWQGYVVHYKLTSNQRSIPCEIYLGTIGYRGNKSTFADEKSRFLVTRIGKGKKQITTQYGFHKYLNTNKKELLPYYELKFNAKGLPKKYWDDVYRLLNDNGYQVEDLNGKNNKILWLGKIGLSEDSDQQVGNLLKGLFAITILKAHYKGKEKGYVFDFLQ
ncbi:endonuclease NucS domain-containing protein [Mesobacillus harenae]|uniref:endonuclease NucS domain-containing protein n=1 Tax=Mesobacillus harenae TaxID=2213203 RepID=UPI00158039D2